MITTEQIRRSVGLLLTQRYADADVFEEEATQIRENVDIFVISADVIASPFSNGYQLKEVEVVVQYFRTDEIQFRRDYGAVKEVLQSEIFVNSIPIVDTNKNVVKYLLVKSSNIRLVDSILSIRITADFIDDVAKFGGVQQYELIGKLEITGEY